MKEEPLHAIITKIEIECIDTLDTEERAVIFFARRLLGIIGRGKEDQC